MQHRDQGFTLIEVLVALAILATVLGVVFSVFSDNLQLTRNSERQRLAAMYAESKLITLGTETSLDSEPLSGTFDDGFFWAMSINDYGDDDDRENWPLTAKLVTLTVSWMEGSFDRSFTISTLRLIVEQ